MEKDLIKTRLATADELQQWPLVHGSANLYKQNGSIRKRGLLAPSISDILLNTHREDALLGREQYVFTSPIWLINGYGAGQLILIDPIILHKPCVRFALHDVIELVKRIKNITSGILSPDQLPKWVTNPAKLLELLETTQRDVETTIDPMDDDLLRKLIISDRVVKQLIKSEGFSQFWSENESDRVGFFNAIADECAGLSMNLNQYAVRDAVWKLKEEIMIPEQVEPEYLLGFWDGQTWESWSLPNRPELLNRLQFCINYLDSIKNSNM